MTSETRDRRRRYGPALKAQILTESDEPGASVAKVAMAHGINGNIVHRWRQLAQGQSPVVGKAGEFMPLSLEMASPAGAAHAAPTDICFELRRGTSMTITLPATAATDFAHCGQLKRIGG